MFKTSEKVQETYFVYQTANKKGAELSFVHKLPNLKDANKNKSRQHFKSF